MARAAANAHTDLESGALIAAPAGATPTIQLNLANSDAFVDGLTPTERESFCTCFALGQFLSRAVATEGWEPVEELAEWVVLSDDGVEAKNVVLARDDLTESAVHAAMLAIMGRERSYVDFGRTDTSALVDWFSSHTALARSDLSGPMVMCSNSDSRSA